ARDEDVRPGQAAGGRGRGRRGLRRGPYRGVGGGGAQAAGGVAGRIARRVPRFATLELDDGHDASGDAVRLAERVREMAGGLKSDGDMANGEGGEPMDTEVSEAPAAEEDVRCRTKAEPFAVADPTLGKVDVDFDPDKVPLLTLLFEIERPSTGFAERWTLSSSSSSAGPGADGNDGKRKSPDERVVESLQHSLFCAGLFESMRGEATPPRPSAVVGAAALPRRRRRDGRQVAWLPRGGGRVVPPRPLVPGRGGRRRRRPPPVRGALPRGRGTGPARLRLAVGGQQRLAEPGPGQDALQGAPAPLPDLVPRAPHEDGGGGRGPSRRRQTRARTEEGQEGGDGGPPSAHTPELREPGVQAHLREEDTLDAPSRRRLAPRRRRRRLPRRHGSPVARDGVPRRPVEVHPPLPRRLSGRRDGRRLGTRHDGVAGGGVPVGRVRFGGGARALHKDGDSAVADSQRLTDSYYKPSRVCFSQACSTILLIVLSFVL
ncbi:hypothetical protein THAOC_33726, partial [Thalassiosira oceanica]